MSQAKTDKDAIAAVRTALMRYGGECEPTAAAARREMEEASAPIEFFLTECARNIVRLDDAIATLQAAEEPDVDRIAEKVRERTRWLRKQDETLSLRRTLNAEHAAFAAAQTRYRLAIEPLVKQGDTRMRNARDDVITYERVQHVKSGRMIDSAMSLSPSGGAAVGGGGYRSSQADVEGVGAKTGGSGGSSYIASRDELSSGRFATDEMVSLDGLPQGMALIPLGKCEDGDRVRGPSDFGKGYSPDDLEWGVTALYEKVLPRVTRGGDVAGLLRDSDVGQGRYGLRSLSDTYSGFFGDSAIAVDRTPNGRFDITNGAHRIWVARQMGVTHLPARVSRLDE